MTLSLGKSVAPLAFSFVLVGGLAGCGGSTTSITGSAPAPSPTASIERQAAGFACADGGDCAVGDIGTGGGVVFYDAGSKHWWGRYLEVAPDGWSGTGADPTAEWCDISDAMINEAAYERIGMGYNTTIRIVNVCSSGAANLARAYAGGGKTDWFLPSKDELNELCEQRERVGVFAADEYWSSSQSDEEYAWNQTFQYLGIRGRQYRQTKDTTDRVRPGRAF